MTSFLAQMRRDLSEWWPLWGSAVVLGLTPLALPLMVSARADEAPDLRLAALTVVAVLYSLVALAVLGDGLMARDTADGRLGFYLARPISAGTFWLARLTAAVALMAAILVSLVLPSALLDLRGDQAPRASIDVSALAVTAPELAIDVRADGVENPRLLRLLLVLGVVGLVLSLLLLAHVASTVARGRSPWSLVDVMGLTLVASLLAATHDVLRSAHAPGALVAWERLFLMTLAVVLGIAGYRQLAYGRRDLARGHGVLSRTAWPLLVVVALALLGAARWVASPTAADLVSAERVWASPNGRLLAVRGKADHRLGLRTDVVFSGRGPEGVIGRIDGFAAASEKARLAWIRCRRYVPLACQVFTWEPAAGRPPNATGISANSWEPSLAMSPHGELLALGGNRLEVWQPELPRLVYALDRRAHLPTFLSASRLRFLHADPDLESTTLEEVDLVDRSVRVITSLPGDMLTQWLVTSPSGRFVLASSMTPPALTLVDSETGAVRDLRTNHDGLDRGDWVASARFLGRDLFLLVSRDGKNWRLLRLDPALAAASASTAEGIELPQIGEDSRPWLGARKDKLLLSAVSDLAAAGQAEPARFELPDGVEPLPGLRVWSLDAETGFWTVLADGVRLYRPPVSAGPQPDSSLFVSGGRSVLRLGDADGGDLQLMVPALPETERDLWF